MSQLASLAALSFGIILSANIISFITDQVSQEEKDKQNKLAEEYRKKQKEAKSRSDKYIKDLTERYSDELESDLKEEKQKQQSWLKNDEKKEFISFITDETNKRIEYVEGTLLKDIGDALDKLKNQRRKHNSALRYNSFLLLNSELKEAKSKAIAYMSYLNRYKNALSDIYDCCTDEKDLLFSFTLPDAFPYNGKLMLLSSDDFDRKTGIGKVTIHRCLSIDFFVNDYDFYEKHSLNNIAVMSVGFDNENHRNIYSIQHGRYKQVAQSGGFNGVTAKVEGYKADGKTILLSYGKDMILNLSAKNLYNFNRFPVIGSEITVFPIREYYLKSEQRVIHQVSQRQEDAEISLDFHEIPLIIPNDKVREFVDYYISYEIDLECDDVKIAPVSESDSDVLNPQKLRLQFGDKYTIVVEIKYKNEKEKDKQYLWFESFIDDKRLTAEDIFIPFNAKIDVLKQSDFEKFIADESRKEIFDNMNNLVLTVFKEFNLQHKLKNSQSGMRYFSAWENITAAVKKYVEKGNQICCRIDGIPKYITRKDKGIILKFKVSDSDLLRMYYEKILTEQENTHIISEFFIEYLQTRYVVEISPDCESFSVFIPESDRGEEENKKLADQIAVSSEITIYKKNYGIPEQRQLNALHNFKIGNMCNSALQLYMLNGEHIIPSCDKAETIKLYNQSLRNNQSQYSALSRSLNEKNIFFIQGPPGTGKTTVIRELIAQTILKEENAKVLIVSQANVAVDNVIKGLVQHDMPFKKDDIIRCGRSGKISQDILDMSYEKKYDDYINSIKLLSDSEPDETVRNLSAAWLDKIKSTYGYNPDVGELIIRNHKIIGATCVGLSQKKIGIDKLVFDLVVIDEAGKALAPEIIIPMIQAKKAVIIGDHKQLPAVINPALYDEEKIELDDRQYCKKEIFDISYFQKLYEKCTDTNKSLLDTQYRMPAVIGTMISQLFYEGKLKNGSGTDCKKTIYGKSNLTIIDMSQEKNYVENDKASPINEYEARYVLHLLKEIRLKNSDVKTAVITPYKGQKAYIKRLLINNSFDYRENDVHIDTVDSFQGDEADIVIYCTTRSKKRTRFMSDCRRINVAVSRTKNEFIMIASTEYLNGYADDEPIKMVLKYIQKNGSIIFPDIIKEISHTMNREIICLSDLIIDGSAEIEIPDKDEVKEEVKYFNKHGRFSCYPLVCKKDNFFLLLKNKKVYYAAIELSLSEIFAELIHDANMSDVQYVEKNTYSH